MRMKPIDEGRGGGGQARATMIFTNDGVRFSEC